MKHQTNRIRKNTTTKTAPVQNSIGQEAAKSGRDKSLGIQVENTKTQAPKLSVEEIARWDALSLLEESTRESNALQMLMFHSLQNEDVDVWSRDNGYLAAGLQTLILNVKHELELADDAVRKVMK